MRTGTLVIGSSGIPGWYQMTTISGYRWNRSIINISKKDALYNSNLLDMLQRRYWKTQLVYLANDKKIYGKYKISEVLKDHKYKVTGPDPNNLEEFTTTALHLAPYYKSEDGTKLSMRSGYTFDKIEWMVERGFVYTLTKDSNNLCGDQHYEANIKIDTKMYDRGSLRLFIKGNYFQSNSNPRCQFRVDEVAEKHVTGTRITLIYQSTLEWRSKMATNGPNTLETILRTLKRRY